MDHTADLHIEEEILPLFDFTFNLFSGKAVRGLIMEPPGRMEAIMYRQQVLQGFIANYEIWKEYSFSRFNLSEIHEFFQTFGEGDFSAKNMSWKLRFSEKERAQRRGRLILLVRLLVNYRRIILVNWTPNFFLRNMRANWNCLIAFYQILS